MPNTPTTNAAKLQPRRWRQRLLSRLLAQQRVTEQIKATGSVVALDWDDRHAVLGWLPKLGHAPEVQTQAIPEGLMIEGQWQDERAWADCLERWVGAIDVSQPLVVVALPTKDLSHHWLTLDMDTPIDGSTRTLNHLINQAMADQALIEQGTLSPADQVFDVLPASDLMPGRTDTHATANNERGCLLGASQAKVASYQALFAASHLRLACMDGRPRALLGYWQQQVSNEGVHGLLDDHLGTTQWWVISFSGIHEMGQFSHQRLSLAERVDHLTQRLAASQASHGLDALWCSHDPKDEAAQVAHQVAQTLGLEWVLMPPVNGHEPSASQQAVVQGLLATPLERTRVYAL